MTGRIEGPDPASLSDAGLLAAADRLERLLEELAAGDVQAEDVKFVWQANRVAYEVLNLEARRRFSAYVDDGIDRLLDEGGDG